MYCENMPRASTDALFRNTLYCENTPQVPTRVWFRNTCTAKLHIWQATWPLYTPLNVMGIWLDFSALGAQPQLK